jgi:cyclopropane-fatty-acyl-phospholipid synthase
MFPLSHMLKAFVRIGTLKVIDPDGRTHVFAGAPGPGVTMLLTDRSLYRKLFFNPELHAGEAYMDTLPRCRRFSLKSKGRAFV